MLATHRHKLEYVNFPQDAIVWSDSLLLQRAVHLGLARAGISSFKNVLFPFNINLTY